MESRILGLLSTLWLLSATAWAADPTSHCLCMSNVWTGKINMNQGLKVGNGGARDLAQYGEGMQYGDLNKGWIVMVIDWVPGGRVNMYMEVDNPFLYIKHTAGCMKMPTLLKIPSGSFCWFNNTKMEFNGTEAFGHGNVEVWQFMDKSSGLFIKQYVSMVSPEEDCFPAYQTTVKTSEGYTFTQGVLLTDYKASVDDPSIFDFPDECKNAVPMPNPVSGTQVKTMSVLALVFTFVLHLGF